MKPTNLPSKVGNFQHLPRFCSILEGSLMQIFVFPQPMRRQEQGGLFGAGTFQPHGG